MSGSEGQKYFFANRYSLFGVVRVKVDAVFGTVGAGCIIVRHELSSKNINVDHFLH